MLELAEQATTLEVEMPRLESTIEEIEARIPLLGAAVVEIQGVEEALARRRDELCADVGRRCDAIVAAVQQRRSELIAACRGVADTKERALIAQRGALHAALEDMRAGCGSARQMLARAALEPGRVLPPVEQLSAELACALTREPPLVPVECAQLQFVDDRPRLNARGAATFGAISGSSIFAAHCTVDGAHDSGDGGSGGGDDDCSSTTTAFALCGGEVLVAGAEVAFTLRAADWRGVACTEGGDSVAVELEYLEHSEDGAAKADPDSTGSARVVDNHDGSYACSVVASAAGRARLHVRVLGAHIRGSPFDLEVQPVGVTLAFGTCAVAPDGGSCNFDCNGVLHYLGTGAGTHEYRNPHGDVLRVVASLSSAYGDSSAARFIEHTHAEPVRNNTQGVALSWMAVDLGPGCRLVPNYYALRADFHPDERHKMRHWHLEASNDGVAWESLHIHVDDHACNAKMGAAAWALDGARVGGRSFRHFRIKQTGKNSSGQNNLMCSGVELYGHASGSAVRPSTAPPPMAAPAVDVPEPIHDGVCSICAGSIQL